MSKEPTGKGRLDSGNEANARRRRRRRGGGLRVPSDKVPRATTNREAEMVEPPEPPEPEAPELAVSVADAFGTGGSAGDPPGEGEEGGAEARAEESEDGAAEAEAETAEADEAEAEAEAGAQDSDDGEEPEAGAEEPEGEAEEPEAESEDPEGEAEADADAEGEAEEAGDESAESAGEAEAGATEAAEAAGDDEATAVQYRGRVPAPDGDDDEPGDAADEEGEPADAAEAGGEPEGGVGVDSVEIPIEEEPQQPKRQRAQTEALTEEDLEELMEPIEDEEEASVAGAAARAEDDVDFDAQETAQFVPVVIEDPEEAEEKPAAESGGAGEARVPTAVTTLERRGISSGEGGGPRDAGDSGELLSDELVQEIDDPTPGAARREGATAPATESRGATLLDTDDYQEVGEPGDGEAARAPDPPPVPGDPPAAKPPPAPTGTPAFVQQANKGRPGAYGKAWFDEIFDEDYLRTLPFLTPQATQAEARFVADAIAASPGAQLLDVGCGYGRHAMELAARGYHVVGLDSSLPLLLRGADEAQRRGLTINFVHGDMRELTFESQFDAAYCLFSTFGYFDDETNKKTAQNVARALKTGARFVVEVLNRDYLIQDLPTRVWWEGDGCVVLEEVDFNYFSSRIVSNRSVVFDDGRQLEQEISIRSYSLHELGKLLHAAGFRVLEVSGNMNTRGRFFGAKARDIIVVAEKRGTG